MDVKTKQQTYCTILGMKDFVFNNQVICFSSSASSEPGPSVEHGTAIQVWQAIPGTPRVHWCTSHSLPFIDLSINGCFDSMAEQPRSQQLPRRVEKLDFVSFGPLGEHRLLCDEAVPSVWSALVEHILGTFIPATWLVVVVRDLPYALGPGRRKKKRHKFSLSVVKLSCMCYFFYDHWKWWCPESNYCCLR